MLKTNSKKARENIRTYITDNFTPEDYDRELESFSGFEEIAAFILAKFREQKYNTINEYRYYKGVEALAFADWCAGLPSLLDTCYYYNRSAVDDLAVILEETEAEKNKYNDEAKAEQLLTSLIYKELIKAAK